MKKKNKPLICIYCGFCVTYCPYNVIGIERAEDGPQTEQSSH